jgi:hypothetical protein
MRTPTTCRLLLLIIVTVAASGAARAAEPEHHCLTLAEPRVLYLGYRTTSEEFAEILRHRIPAAVDYAPMIYTHTDFHHLCDKPLEEPKDQQAYVQQQGREYVDRLTGRLGEYDVVIAQFHPKPRDEEQRAWFFDVERRLADYARGGGNLVFINPSWEITFSDTPLAEVLPVRFERRKAWSTSLEGATDHPITRGLPLGITGAHWYGPIYEPVDDTCIALTDSPRAEYWYRPLPGGG